MKLTPEDKHQIELVQKGIERYVGAMMLFTAIGLFIGWWQVKDVPRNNPLVIAMSESDLRQLIQEELQKSTKN